MVSETVTEIHQHVARYLLGDDSIESFRDWLEPIAWEETPGESDASRLLASISLRLAEYTSGHLSEVEFREVLRDEVYLVGVRIGATLSRDFVAPYESRSSSVTETQDQVVWRVSDRLSAVASA